MKQIRLEKLSQYNYNFKEIDNKIIIDMGTWQEITVNLIDDKIDIQDKLKSWNILTTFPMKIKTALESVN